MQYVKSEKTDIKASPELNESWVQGIIAEDPQMLGLGDLILKDKERIQPRAGRLDLLLQDEDGHTRYEVEVQLGKSDESHIIRTMEYWDIEQKRYPQYEHVAVLPAEDITSRFLNVIGLFNGAIPFVAIQMDALKVNDITTLTFTKVLDLIEIGTEEDDESKEVTDRAYWEKKAMPETMAAADKVLDLINEFAPEFEFKYNKFYIGNFANGKVYNFCLLKPKKKLLTIELRGPQDESLEHQFEKAQIEFSRHNRWNLYVIRLKPKQVDSHRDSLQQWIKNSYNCVMS